MRKEAKEMINSISAGQLWESKSEGLAKGHVIKIIKRGKQCYWKTTRVDSKAPKHRIPTHQIRDWDLIKYYKKQ